MRIGICDDHPQELERIASLVADYRQEKKCGLTYGCFPNALELVEAVRKGSFDLLILDVVMPAYSGMEAAHEIRTFDKNVQIIFLTSSPEFAVESYSVKAYTYLLKPITKEKLFPVLDDFWQTSQQAADFLCVKCKTGAAHLLFSSISHVEVLNKTLFFHLADGTVYEVPASLAEFEAVLLARGEFMRVHRSFIINVWQMKELHSQSFTTISGKTIPISRRLYSQTRHQFISHLFAEKPEPSQPK